MGGGFPVVSMASPLSPKGPKYLDGGYLAGLVGHSPKPGYRCYLLEFPFEIPVPLDFPCRVDPVLPETPKPLFKQ